MGGAAQKDESMELIGFEAELEQLPATGTDGAASSAALRQVASERLAAHRRRKAAAEAEQQQMEAEMAARQQQRRGGASRVRDAVAARYESSVSYHEFLAQEAERALLQAQAEAEVAARSAQAVADAQMRLLEEVKQMKAQAESVRPVAGEAAGKTESKARGDFASAMADIVEAATEAMHLRPRIEMAAANEASPSPGLTVRLYEDLAATPPSLSKLARHNGVPPAAVNADEHAELDEEIAFRLSPEFEDARPAEPVTVSGNLIEFPRQLVAAKRQRPRIAEGPLREEGAGAPQLRIFEVEPEQVSAAAPETAAAPEWQSILLEHSAAVERVDAPSVQPQYALQPLTAPVSLRLMAVAVDGCAVVSAFIAFAGVVLKLGDPQLEAMPLPAACVAAAVAIGILAVLYQVLFFTLSDATPGMRYARIGLCTFGDANPSRKAMRKRILATIVAACPLGLGLLWAWMDEDGLGWHDRISRMYQRAY